MDPIIIEAISGIIIEASSVALFMQSHNTVLHLASQAGHTGVVDLLLKSGADTKAVNSVSQCKSSKHLQW